MTTYIVAIHYSFILECTYVQMSNSQYEEPDIVTYNLYMHICTCKLIFGLYHYQPSLDYDATLIMLPCLYTCCKGKYLTLSG